MRKIVFALFWAAVLALSACAPPALAASEEIRPVSVEEYGNADAPRIKRVYQLAVSEDPKRIPTEDFIRDGYRYSLMDLTMKNEIGVDTKEYTETVTMDTRTGDTAEAIKLLDAQKEVTTEDGYHGTLILDHTSVKVSVKGYKTNTKNITAERTYSKLLDADLELIPKTISENGNSLTLSDAQWTSDTDEDGNLRFTATAVYTGTSTSRYATGYVMTANYTGNVVKTNCELITYTAIFGGEELPKTAAADVIVPPMPEELTEPEPPDRDGASSDAAPEPDGDISPEGEPEQRLYLDGEHWLAVGVCVCAIGTMAVSIVYFSRQKKKGANTGT